jgi:CRP/FNR family transcriptional activator FtrB
MHIDASTRLESVALFDGVDQSVLTSLAGQTFVLDVPQRIVVLQQNQPVDALRIIVSGMAIAFCRHGMREAAMGLLSVGDSFLWPSLICGFPSSVSVQTVQDSRLLVVPLTTLQELMRTNNRFCANVMKHQSILADRQMRALKGLKLRSATERLAAWILENSSKTKTKDRVDLPIEKQLLASELSMTPENLARGLNTLTAHGIKLDGKRKWISNNSQLQRFVAPTADVEGPQVEHASARPAKSHSV